MAEPGTPKWQNLGDRPWHARTAREAIEAFESDAEQGLNAGEVERRRLEVGENRLTPASHRSTWLRFFSQFKNLFLYLLLMAGVVTALLGEWIDSVVIVAVVLIIAMIGFFQEGRAERALESVRDMLSSTASVRRNARRHEIAAEELVPGDIVQLGAGDRVPADLRLIRSQNLQAQEAALTGESTPVEKHTEALDEDAQLGDRSNMAYSSTIVTAGQGIGVVIAIGDGTEIGRISGMLSEIKTVKTPLMQRLDAFTKVLSAVIIGLAALTFLAGTLLWNREWGEMFLAAVSIAVAAIPEGLPAVMTVTLAIGVERMAKRHAIIRRLPAVETLGSITTVCADKTGTLTRNEMTAKTLRTADDDITAEGVGYQPHGDLLTGDRNVEIEKHEVALEMMRAGLLCNDADLKLEGDEWKPEGDPTEAALIVLAHKAGFASEKEHGDWPRIDAIPFASERRYMATLNHDHNGNHRVYVKGAPERVLEMCKAELRTSGIATLDTEGWLERADAIAGRGQRLLAIASKEVGACNELRESDVEEGLTFLGLFGLIDPPRDEAIAAVRACQQAGIRIKMITGDHVATASAVARELGLHHPETVLSGHDLESLSEHALQEKAVQVNVFARASPEHKLRLVEAFQECDDIVAMTGDGVNDAPALKRADVGISMGQKGTEAAREASDMILADDNFASIEHAIEEGRKVYDNLRKAILFILPTNAAQALIISTSIMFGFALPITPLQILWVNMLTAVTLGIAFAWEQPEGDLMQRPPHPSDQSLLTRFVLWRIGFVGILLTLSVGFLFMQEQGRDASTVAFARTMSVNALVMGQIFYLFNTRFFQRRALSWDGLLGNKVALIAIATCIALQMIFTYTPVMHTLFETAALDLEAWARCVAVGVVVFIFVEIEKLLSRRRSSVSSTRAVASSPQSEASKQGSPSSAAS